MSRFILVLTAAVLMVALLALPASARGGEFAPKEGKKEAEKKEKESQQKREQKDDKKGPSLVTDNSGVVSMALLVGGGMAAHRLVRKNQQVKSRAQRTSK